MQKKVLLTTTTSIPNYEIVESKGIVFANVVLGTNFFSDFAASFTDTFGGTSDTYQGKLDKIYAGVTEKLTKKVLDLGCNAIIGFKIDFDEISGKGVSMFMVNAIGTACKVKSTSNNLKRNDGLTIDIEDLENAVQKYKIIEEIKSKQTPRISDDTIEYLLEHPIRDISDELLDYYYTVKIVGYGTGISAGGAYVQDNSSQRIRSNINFINQYIRLILDEEITDKIYALYLENNIYLQIIEECQIFDSKHVLLIAEKDPYKALPLLGIKKESYSKDDAIYFKQIANKYDNLPDRGKFELSRGGIFSKGQKQFVCEAGHTNNEDVEFCEKCGKNIKGLTKEDLQHINDLKIMAKVLEEYFK